MKKIFKTHCLPILYFKIYDHLFRLISIWWYTWRTKILLKMLECKFGENFQVDGKLIIRTTKEGAISIGDNVRCISRIYRNLVGITNPTIIQCIGAGRIVIGNNTGFSSTIFSARNLIEIGNHVKIGANCRILDHDYHALDYVSRREPALDAKYCKSNPIKIDDDVFIGTNTIILKGVHIGARSIIGAGSVVSLKDIPPDSLVSGNPAKIIKSLK